MFLLMGIGAGAMYVPAIHALVLGQYQVGRAFLYSGTLLLVLTGMIWLAWANRRPRNVALSQFYALVGAYVVMPPLLAVPMLEAVEGMSMLDAWFEMVSAFTTTGASLRPPEALPPPVHLWRALVGWFGGFFVLVGAATILAPMNLGGFELLADAPPGRPGSDGPDPAERLRGYALRILPVYGGLTLVLWIILVAAGEGPFVALCHAMGTLSTSGISPVGGFEGGSASDWAEGAILVGLCLALTRRSLPGAVRVAHDEPLWRDPELRLAVVIVGGAAAVLLAHHLLGLVGAGKPVDLLEVLAAAWAMLFTALSFLTTTGYLPQGWTGIEAGGGIGTPVVLLLGLAIVGGGVATTTGGVRLLRVHALARMSVHEIERLAQPSSVARNGGARQMRRAPLAFVVFMLYALGLGIFCALLSIAGADFEASVVMSVAALSTAGQLADIAAQSGGGFAELGAAGRTIAALAMIVGRLETLAFLTLALPRGGYRWTRL
jgi:trk system potassium uptake protein TrkH